MDRQSIVESNGTKWTNDQLLFHMLFGYLIVRTLLILVRALARAPRSVSKQFAAVLNSAAAPFHVVNYVGSLGGARVLGHSGMNKAFDLVVAHFVTSLEKDPDSQLRRGMHFPVPPTSSGWRIAVVRATRAPNDDAGATMDADHGWT